MAMCFFYTAGLFLSTQQITGKHRGQCNNSCHVRRSQPCMGSLVLMQYSGEKCITALLSVTKWSLNIRIFSVIQKGILNFLKIVQFLKSL